MAEKLNKEIRDLIGTKQTRSAVLDRGAIDVENRTVRLAFSSSAPYERFWGIEVLDHSPDAVRMDRLANNAAVLINHDWDKQAGAVKNASIDSDDFGRADVQLSRNQLGADALRDIEDGILTKVSVGYIVHKMILEEQTDDGPDVYRVTDWEPYEISFVSVPADDAVGVGRSMENESDSDEAVIEPNKEAIEMAEEKKIETPEVDVSEIRAEARKDETDRVSGILAVGRKFDMAENADAAIKDGTPLAKFQRDVFDSYEIPTNPQAAEVGLTEKEAKEFSFLRAIRAKADPGNLRLQEEAAFELECSRAVEDKLGRKAQGVFVPEDVLARDFIAGGGGTGQYLVGTDHLAGSFIDVLRNKLAVMQMGATELNGLVGDLAIPSMTAAHTAYWVAESGAVTESKPTMGQHTMSPKTIGAFNDISRKLLIQSSPDAEALVRNDIASVLAAGIDLAALHGTGTNNQPSGIAVTSGIGSVVGDTNGAAPDWADIVKLQTDVSQDNGDIGKAGYLTSARIRGKLLRTFINTTGGDTPLWTNNPSAPGEGYLNGMRAVVSNQVSDTLPKGSSDVASAIFYSGNWADLVIGYWSGLDLLIDPYSGSTSGTVRVVGLQDMDIDVRHPQCFSAMLDALSA